MKIAIAFVILLLLLSCTPPYNIYHSTVDIPHQVYDNKTDIHLIPSPSGFYFLLGLAAAKDESFLNPDIDYYVILAPSNSRRSTEVSQLRLNYAVNLKPLEVKELINSIDSILIVWDNEIDETVGFFYEFNSVPEHQVTQLSPNVIEYVPTFKFYFQKQNDDSKAILSMGPESFHFIYHIKEKIDLQKFNVMLLQAMNELRRMGYGRSDTNIKDS